MEWLDAYDALNEVREVDTKGRIVTHQWMNDVPLHGDKDAVRVNFFRKTTMTLDPTGQQKFCRTESWVTDLDVTDETSFCLHEAQRVVGRWRMSVLIPSRIRDTIWLTTTGMVKSIWLSTSIY